VTPKQTTVDALLDAYADRGTAINNALAILNAAIEAPITDYAKQRPLQDLARDVRAALTTTK